MRARSIATIVDIVFPKEPFPKNHKEPSLPNNKDRNDCVTGHRSTYILTLKELTCPFWSRLLFVSLSLWNVTGCFIQCAPLAGESGWMYRRPGMCGSALPFSDENILDKQEMLDVFS